VFIFLDLGNCLGVGNADATSDEKIIPITKRDIITNIVFFDISTTIY